MKKFLLAALSVMMLFTILGCKDEPENKEPAKDIVISFNTDGAGNVTAVTIKAGKSLGDKLPGAPTKAGFTFEGWYDGDSKVTEKTTFKKAVTLKAKWAEVLCACSGCALNGKGVSTGAGLYCSNETHATSCTVCETIGVAPYSKLMGDKRSIDRTALPTGSEIVYGTDFAAIADDLEGIGNDSGGTIAGKAGTGTGTFVWAYNTKGGGQNSLTLLPAGTVSLTDATGKKMFILEFVGRFSVGSIPNGNFNMKNGSGLTGPNAQGQIGAKVTLTENMVDMGLELFVNQWGANAGEEVNKVFSIDDLVVYKVDAPVVSILTIALPKPVGGVEAATEINSTQFTGVVTWTPALDGGKFVKDGEYTASIVIAAKAGFQIVDLTDTTVFAIAGKDADGVDTDYFASYTAATKTVLTKQYPPAIRAPDAVDLNFTNITVVGSVPELDADPAGVVEKLADGKGYTFDWDGFQYKGVLAKFEITIQDGFSLGDFTTLTVDVTGMQGDFQWKPIALFAKPTAEGGIFGELELDWQYQLQDELNPKGSTFISGICVYQSTNDTRYNTGTETKTFIIDKTLAENMTGKVELGIFLPCGPGTAPTYTKFRFENFRLAP